jgi:hypothetical protein
LREDRGQVVNQRECQLALGQILPHGLAECGATSGQIENVILNLERDTDAGAEPLEPGCRGFIGAR